MDLYLIAILVLGAAIFVFAHFKKKASKGLGPLAPSKHGWLVEHSEGTPQRPALAGSGWSIDVPLAPGFLGTIKNFDAPQLQVGDTIRVKGRIEGSGIRSVENPAGPAHCSVIVQRKEDQYLDPKFRWYSEQTIPLVDGDFELEVKVTVEGMFDMEGGRDAGNLVAALKEQSNVGIGFGGDGGRAHGVYAVSPTRFYLTELLYR